MKFALAGFRGTIIFRPAVGTTLRGAASQALLIANEFGSDPEVKVVLSMNHVDVELKRPHTTVAAIERAYRRAQQSRRKHVPKHP